MMMKTTKTTVYLVLLISFQICWVHSINPFNLKQESISTNLFDLTNQSIGLKFNLYDFIFV